VSEKTAEAVLDVATTDGITPFRANAILSAAGVQGKVSELMDRRLWACIGGEWRTVAEWADMALSAD